MLAAACAAHHTAAGVIDSVTGYPHYSHSTHCTRSSDSRPASRAQIEQGVDLSRQSVPVLEWYSGLDPRGRHEPDGASRSKYSSERELGAVLPPKSASPGKPIQARSDAHPRHLSLAAVRVISRILIVERHRRPAEDPSHARCASRAPALD